jgi:hypothetical protein
MQRVVNLVQDHPVREAELPPHLADGERAALDHPHLPGVGDGREIDHHAGGRVALEVAKCRVDIGLVVGQGG